ncbi:dolichol monophosphate mannose synthase [Kaistia sp. 32K]|uniref:glycosyltransferase family 2 protein n=1 Tax=Kaistia sp. 32K TaxID=2795690 RepID=UPI001915D52C|nr:glycosyltransferase family 2 protein [Kaistia sp. 32K]BCP55954.1 dolichol monophosphate mannose synthase [Kaistia sp. 32K]
MNFPVVAAVSDVAPQLTVVIPTFNEVDNIDPLLARLRETLGALRWEAIFVDDNSPDGTARALRDRGRLDPRIRCIRRVGRRGLAGACIEGMLAAQGPIVAVMDADLQHDDSLLPRMYDAMTEGADVVVATRYAEGGAAASFTATRSMLSRTATVATQKLLGVTSSDPMSGFFMLRRELIDDLSPRLSSQGFKILLDILATAPAGLKIVEIPYAFASRQNGESKLDNRVLLDFLGLLVAKVTRDVVPIRFVSFAAVGTLGLALHLAVLRTILVNGAHFATAQSVATFAAMTSNFLINNVLTYRDRRLRGWRLLPGLAKFYAICGLGAAANIGVGSWVFWETSRWWVAGIAGSLIGVVWNYAVSTALVWRDKP